MEQPRPLQAKAASYKAKLEAIQTLESSVATIRETLSAHPDLRPDFASELRLLADDNSDDDTLSPADGPPETTGTAHTMPTATVDLPPPSTLVRIIRFLQNRGNRPTSLADILANVKGNPVTIKTILYKRNRHRFRKVPVDGAAGAYWQLADSLEFPEEGENEENEAGSDGNTTAPREGGSS